MSLSFATTTTTFTLRKEAASVEASAAVQYLIYNKVAL